MVGTQDETCQILRLAENPRWSRVRQYVIKWYEIADTERQFLILVLKLRVETYLLANFYGIPDSDIATTYSYGG